ncbi:hypothetical protein SFRURICE_018555 [Spodoptera frugiperda]|nr:hypothetical protein SFRURICE_018555 [Spodoptera frugiperda]
MLQYFCSHVCVLTAMSLIVLMMWQEWNDYNLRWNDSDYGGVKDLRITPNKLWKPDVLMYNSLDGDYVVSEKILMTQFVLTRSADEGFDGTYQTNVVVRNNGSCLYVPPGIFKSTCKIDITWFPFDDQHCDMKFGSWTYDGNQLDLVLKDEAGGDLSDFITNGEWYLIGMPGKKNTITYACCPEPYVDVTFTIMIRRRTLYYFFNLIVPCVLISSMALLGFTLPPDSGEKLTLGVTILLSLTVFLNLVAETLPQVSDAIPLLGTLPKPNPHRVTILLSQTVFSLLVGHVITKTSEAIPLIVSPSLETDLCFYSALAALSTLEIELLHFKFVLLKYVAKQTLSKGTYFNCIMFMVASSVVLTVVVLNYHHRTADIHEMPQWIKSVFLQWLPWILRMSRPGKKITRKTIMMNTRMRELELKERSSKSLLANVLDIDDDFRHAPPPPNSTASTGNLGPGCSIFRTDFRRSFVRPSTMEDVGGGLASHHRELHLILRELQFITARMKKADEEAELISDWKFAAMVVDRFCLFVFTLFTIIATVAVLLSAPHIIVQ